MKVNRYIPSPALRPFIKSFMIIESEAAMQNRILPDTCMVMAFRFRGSISYQDDATPAHMAASVITGLRRSIRLINYSKDTATLLVTFQETGPSALFNVPAHELFGSSVSLDALFPKDDISEMEEQLSAAESHPARFRLMEEFLLHRLSRKNPDQLVIAAVNAIRLANGHLNMKNLAAALCISQDPFEKRFRKITGTSPKHFASIIRLRNLITNYSPALSFTEMAYGAGYFDQTHFIKDFKSFTGQTPQVFFQSARYW